MVIIPDKELTFTYVQSSGPGGQNVNKVATAVQLRFDVRNSPTLTNEVKMRLAKLVRNKLTQEGVLIIVAKRYRTQEQNRADATQRLYALILEALVEPKRRQATKPSAAAKINRINAKKSRGDIKKSRGKKNQLEE